MGTLTVRENFLFSAGLRLPKDVTDDEKKLRVSDIITELGLTHCADSKVGNSMLTISRETPFNRKLVSPEKIDPD
jgi:ATP-binding cassette subfamily G (WHITE) protein 2